MTAIGDYGLTAERRAEMLEEQGGRCAICRDRPAQVVDHDHTTGRVRGLLCSSCNRGLGFFRDSDEILARAAVYVGAATPDLGELSSLADNDLRLAFTLEEAARILRIPTAHVRDLLRDGRLSAVKIGRIVRITRRSIDAFIAEAIDRVERRTPSATPVGTRALALTDTNLPESEHTGTC